VLLPEDAAQIERQYRPGTNVLETTYSTATGRVRVTDVMTLPDGGLTPFRELARRVDGLAGCVTMRWRGRASLRIWDRLDAHRAAKAVSDRHQRQQRSGGLRLGRRRRRDR
jgi:hypothetical protein